ncbi:MAG: hypothetical protein J5918_08790 [Prevotella sp.]|nr:hypothetical protein [Prevotella sp.]
MEINEIIESLLSGYESKETGKSINDFLKDKGLELNLSEDGLKKLDDASSIIDKMSENAESLQNAKNNGRSLKWWLMNKIKQLLKDFEQNDKKKQLVEVIYDKIDAFTKNDDLQMTK